MTHFERLATSRDAFRDGLCDRRLYSANSRGGSAAADDPQAYSLLELHLETGRTHQIRVHMKYLGYPLPGDYLYHPDYRIIDRQPLHSYQIQFRHPVTEKDMLFTAPVPEDFVRAFYRFFS